jgi:hypothetical protein
MKLTNLEPERKRDLILWSPPNLETWSLESVPGSDDWCLTGEVDAFVQVSIPAVSQKAVNSKPLFELERGLGSVSGPHRGTLIDMRCLASRCCTGVDLFFGLPCKEGTSWISACEALDSSVQ